MKIRYQILIILITLWTNIAFAQNNKVLMINSDPAILRYQQIADEFKKTLSKTDYQLLELNLQKISSAEEELKILIEKENPDFIYCIGGPAYTLSYKVVENKTLLFSAVINWQRFQTSDKTYGISNELLPEQDMTLLHLFFPDIKKVGVLYSEKFNQEYIEKIKSASTSLNIEIVSQSISSASEINAQLTELLPKVDMLWLIAEPVVLDDQNSVQEIFKMSQQYKKPVYAYSDVYIKYGAMLSVSFDPKTIARQAARLMMSLQQGQIPKPSVQPPAGSAVTLNMCVVDALNMAINKDSLDSVNTLVFCNQK